MPAGPAGSQAEDAVCRLIYLSAVAVASIAWGEGLGLANLGGAAADLQKLLRIGRSQAALVASVLTSPEAYAA